MNSSHISTSILLSKSTKMFLTFVHQHNGMRKNEDSRIFQYFFLQNIDFPDMKDFKMIIF